jgi:hypothetical protein
LAKPLTLIEIEFASKKPLPPRQVTVDSLIKEIHDSALEKGFWAEKLPVKDSNGAVIGTQDNSARIVMDGVFKKAGSFDCLPENKENKIKAVYGGLAPKEKIFNLKHYERAIKIVSPEEFQDRIKSEFRDCTEATRKADGFILANRLSSAQRAAFAKQFPAPSRLDSIIKDEKVVASLDEFKLIRQLLGQAQKTAV